MSVIEKIESGSYVVPSHGLGYAEAYRLSDEQIVEYQSDLEKEFGVTDHPEADMLFAMAWERSPVGDFSAVYWAYKELSALVM